MSDTTVKVGQIYRSNDKRDHFGRWIKVVSVGGPDGEGYARVCKVVPGRLEHHGGSEWVESGTRTSVVRFKSLGTTWQTGYTLVDGD